MSLNTRVAHARTLKPMLFDDEYIELARATRPSPVTKARRSDQPEARTPSAWRGRLAGLHSFRTLLDYPATLEF